MNENLTVSANERNQFKYAMIALTITTLFSLEGNSIAYILCAIVIMFAVRFLNKRDIIAKREYASIVVAAVVVLVALSAVANLVWKFFGGENYEERGLANTVVLIIMILVDLIGWVVYRRSEELVAASNAGAQKAAASDSLLRDVPLDEAVTSLTGAKSSAGADSQDKGAEPTDAAKATVTCPKCGTVLPASNVFCHVCGTKVKE